MRSGMNNSELEQVSQQPQQPQPDVPIVGSIQAGPAVKIGLLVPTNINIDVRFCFSFQQILSQLPPGSTYMADYRYGLAETREALVTQAIKTIPDLTHILFVDTDVIPLVPNGIQLLLQDNKPIVSGIYFSSLMTGAAAWRKTIQKDQNGNDVEVETPIPVDGQTQFLQEVDKTGFGFTLIQKQVFDILAEKNEPRPWFYYLVDSGELRMQSEDFYFLDKCKKHGIRPWVDLRVQCGHIKSVVINPNGSVQTPPHNQQQPTGQGQK